MSTETLDFAMNFDDNQQSEADKKLAVMFYRTTEKNETKSVEFGRPIFDEIDCIKILTPGSRDTFVGIATEQYQERFASQWARYKAGREQVQSGTLLSQLPWMSLSQIAELGAVGCKTIEQLVSMPDSLSQKFMGHHQIKQRAQEYLNYAKDQAPAMKLKAELEKRDEQIAELQIKLDAVLNELNAKVPLKA